MLPKMDTDLSGYVTLTTQPSETYKLDVKKHRITGTCTGLEAMQQAIYKIINSERFEHIIYSWNYGIEMKHIFGKSRSFAQAELKRVIKEALMQDDRIKGVNEFSYALGKDFLNVTFKVNTIYGEILAEKEVTL